MLRELLSVTNLEDALTNQIKASQSNRGLYIFLDNKIYDEQELNDEFISKNTSFISKKSTPNPLLDEKIKKLSIYGFAINGNKQIFSVQGLNTIYSQLYSVSNIKNFLESPADIKKADNFYEKGFTEDYIESKLKKTFTLSGSKDNKQAILEKQNDLIKDILEKNKKIISTMNNQALTTLDVIKKNKTFIDKIIEKYSVDYPSEIKTIRLNVIVSDKQELVTLKDESYLYFYHSLLAYQGFYYKNDAYFYSSISSNYNESKPMMYLNRSDAPNVGNDVLMEKELSDHISLYLYIRALAQTTKNPIKTFYIDKGLITNTPTIGALRYKILDDKKTYYIISCSTLSEWNKDGSRAFDLTFEHYISKEKNRYVTISSYEELAKLIFFGSKEKSLSNQLYVAKSESDNGVLKNKYFEGNDLSPESKKIYYLIEEVGRFEKGLDSLHSVFYQLRKDVLLSSRYEDGAIWESVRNYRNVTNFWDSLTQQENQLGDRLIYIDDIDNDEDYLIAIVRLYLYLFYTVNGLNKEHQVFTAKDINQLVKTTRYSVLFERLIQYKKKYQYVFDEKNRDAIEKDKIKLENEYFEKKEKNPYIKKIIQPEYEDYLSNCIKSLKNYRPKKEVIIDQEQLIYALIINASIKIKKENEETNDD